MKPEFKAFPKMPHYNKALQCTVTQKIHGTNAAIVVTEEGEVYCQSRTRFITPQDDNYGFAAFVEGCKESVVGLLKPGIHYGEWAGPGINSGEGLTERTFILFNSWRYKDVALPSQFKLVPVLYSGRFDAKAISKTFEKLRTDGSALVPGFMRPEGIVVCVDERRYKFPFQAEETKWKQGSGIKVPFNKGPKIDVDHLLQPIRLEKLLSRDERLVREFPTTLPDICREYLLDMMEEHQLDGIEPPTLKALKSELFNFIKQFVEKM